MGLPAFAKVVTGWPTPAANEFETQDPARILERRAAAKAKHANNGFGLTLGQTVAVGGWPTPNAIPEGRGGLASNPEAALRRRQQGHMLNLDDAATLAGWATPTTRDHKDGSATSVQNVPVNALLGRQAHLSGPAPSGSPALTENRGALSPQFSLWLQGYPSSWAAAAPLKAGRG